MLSDFLLLVLQGSEESGVSVSMLVNIILLVIRKLL